MRGILTGIMAICLLAVASGVWAVTIDGLVSPSTEWDSAAHKADPKDDSPIPEYDIPDDWDIKDGYVIYDWVNNWLYFRIDVFGTPTLESPTFPGVYGYYDIYIDKVGYGSDTQPDWAVRYTNFGGTIEVRLFNYPIVCPLCYIWKDSTAGAQSTVTEIGIPLDVIPLECGDTVNLIAYLDNQGLPPDDWIKSGYTLIPEPGSLTLLTLGLGGAVALFRRK